MGAWGFRALESDTGLDVIDSLQIFFADRDQLIISEVIEHFRREELLPEEELEIDFLYDHTNMVLAELLSEFSDTGKIVFNFMDEKSNEYERHITKVFYSGADIDFLFAQINDILRPAGEVHETYELWEDSDLFLEWKNHVAGLLVKLKMLR